MAVVTFGEIMLRLSPPGYQRFAQADTFEATYGGGEANVAIALASFMMTTIRSQRRPQIPSLRSS